MQYQGGKTIVGKYIAPFVDEALEKTEGRYVEPFVGSCSLLHRLNNVTSAELSDVHRGLISMHQAYQEGWRPKAEITEEEYKQLKKENRGDPWSTFISFACAFGGIEWGSFARWDPVRSPSQGRPYPYITAAHNAIKRKWEGTIDQPHIEFIHRSFFDVGPKESSTIYCDPPYANTQKYKVGDFDTEAFYDHCEHLASKGHIVLVSEFSNPRGYEVLWSKERKVTMARKASDYKTKKELLLKVDNPKK